MPLSEEQARKVDKLKSDLQRRFQDIPSEFWDKAGDVPLLESRKSPRLPAGHFSLIDGERTTVGEKIVTTVITPGGIVTERLIHIGDDANYPAFLDVELGEISPAEYLKHRDMIYDRIGLVERFAARAIKK